jgi:hypothetical protein
MGTQKKCIRQQREDSNHTMQTLVFAIGNALGRPKRIRKHDVFFRLLAAISLHPLSLTYNISPSGLHLLFP